MNITEVEAVLGRPRGASPVKDWQCWGEDTWFVDWGTEESHLASIIVNEKTAEVLCIELFSLTQAFRWVQKEFRQDFFKECLDRKIDPEDSDGLGLWQDIEQPEAILVVAAHITGEL
jgi:hypothetical protein